MSKKRKKQYQSGQQKLQEAQHRNDYFKQLGSFLKAVTGEDVLQLIPPELKMRMYDFRQGAIKVEAFEGHNIPLDLINSVKDLANRALKMKLIGVVRQLS